MVPRGISKSRFDTARWSPNCLVTASSRTAESGPEEWLKEVWPNEEWLNDTFDPVVRP